jgi:predicted nucleotidyltransferase
MVQIMKKRLRKKKAYKQYIQDIFKGYETMLENKDLPELHFSYLKEETILKRDEKNQIRFRTFDKE